VSEIPGSRSPLRVGLKVDVDTYRGLDEGVPRLIEIFSRAGVRASFFVTMGPDRSGRAITRVFRHKGFLRKMFRSGALRMYGWRTVLSGTLLPAREVGRGLAHRIREIEAAGHEAGIHGWDHVRWHDRLDRLKPAEVADHLRRAIESFTSATGHAPAATAAPGWHATDESLACQERMGFAYASDTRGRAPYVPLIGTRPSALLQIPTTLSTLDELLGRPDLPGGDPIAVWEASLRKADQPVQVLTLHAEVEGMAHASLFERALGRIRSAAEAGFERLDDLARSLDAATLPARPVVRGRVPGRAGYVSCEAEG
jgi:undecaprenyl phosphate-alpha-L-ara4FN deformylase